MYLGLAELSARDVVAILREDPDLGEGIDAADLEVARRTLRAHEVVLDPGPWEPQEVVRHIETPAIGLLVLDGLITRELRIAGRPSTELLGATDVLRPWDQDAESGALPVPVEWQVMARSRVAILDRKFLVNACHYPTLIDALMSRTLRRARWLAFQVGVKQITRVEGRLLVLLWALSDRWGVVTPRGVQVRLRLTHEALAKLVGARRPSVTTALGVLSAAGEIERHPDGYLLLGEPDTALRRAARAEPEPET